MVPEKCHFEIPDDWIWLPLITGTTVNDFDLHLVPHLSTETEGSEKGPQKTALERWQESLLHSTSLPQLILHLSILEGSIAWTKSALHARCRICRRKGDGEKMLLCDGCDRGHHMYCLKPAVKVSIAQTIHAISRSVDHIYLKELHYDAFTLKDIQKCSMITSDLNFVKLRI
jgi:hypothetical protein